MYRIYALINNLNQEIFYIGQSKQKYICKRKANHIEDAKNNVKTHKKNIYIRACDYQITLKVLEEINGNLEDAYLREQYYIDLYKPCCNISRAKTTPPKMGGYNKTIFPLELYNLLGTMPDYILAEKFNSNKRTIARIRKEKGIKSYAEQTGNNGRHKVGEAKGTVKGFYTKFTPEMDALLGTMSDKKLSEIINLSCAAIFKRRKRLNINSFGNNHGRKKSI